MPRRRIIRARELRPAAREPEPTQREQRETAWQNADTATPSESAVTLKFNGRQVWHYSLLYYSSLRCVTFEVKLGQTLRTQRTCVGMVCAMRSYFISWGLQPLKSNTDVPSSWWLSQTLTELHVRRCIRMLIKNTDWFSRWIFIGTWLGP